MQDQNRSLPWLLPVVMLFAALAAGCSGLGPGIPGTGGSAPTLTLVPTLALPTVSDAPTVTVTPSPTPVPTVYDPLNATLAAGSAAMTAIAPAEGQAEAVDVQVTPLADAPDTPPPAGGAAEQPSATPPPPPATAPEEIPTGRLTGMIGLIPSEQGLWAMRMDGTQATLLTRDPIFSLRVSPGGTMAAYLTSSVPNSRAYEQPFGYQLKLMTLYDNQVYTILNLDPPGLSESSPPEELDNAFQTLLAYQRGGLAWSPTGRTLAFVSAHEGGGGDIYLYTPSNGGLSRLTALALPEGRAHAYALDWSADSARLFYSAAYSFGSGSGTWLAGAWVTTLNGDQVQIAEGGQSFEEELIAWLPGLQGLVRSGGPDCDKQNLRMVNMRNGQVTGLWPGCYSDMLYDRARAEVVVSVTPDDTGPQEGSAPGVYTIPLYRPEPRMVSSIGFSSLLSGDFRYSWLGYNPGQGMAGISRSGQVTPVFEGPPYNGSTGAVPSPLTRLPDGSTWLWTGAAPNGMFAARPGEEPQLVLTVPPESFTQSPTLYGLYFFILPDGDTTRLYGMRARDWQPYIIDERIRGPQGIFWTLR